MKTDCMIMHQLMIIKCPICEKDVRFFKNKKFPPSFPFCSRRCKLIDLGNWLGEKYKLSEPIIEGQEPLDDES